MKKLFSLITLLATITFCKGQATQTYVTNNMALGIATIATSPGVLTSLTAYTTNTAASFIYLYDDYFLATNAAWTNYTVYTTNVATSYITSTGITNSMTNTYLKTIASPHAAIAGAQSTPTLTLIVPGAPSGGTVFATFDDPLLFGKRLSFSNTATGLTLLVKYRLE